MKTPEEIEKEFKDCIHMNYSGNWEWCLRDAIESILELLKETKSG